MKKIIIIASAFAMSGAATAQTVPHYPLSVDINQPAEKTCSDYIYVSSRFASLNYRLSGVNENYFQSQKEVLGADYDEYIGVKLQKRILESHVKNARAMYRLTQHGNQDALTKVQYLETCVASN